MNNLNVNDLKAAFNRVKAAVMNLTELEQKVKEATNNDIWGTSSTVLKEISRETYNPQGFNEIMPAIYRRFSQEGRTWRNIYKALILIEYIVLNGSERAVDYCKNHIYEIKACTSYQYIDEKGKDEGVNVRHRAKAIVDLLQDEVKIRQEREKAAEFQKKVKGQSVGSVEYESGSKSQGYYGSSSISSSSKYGGTSSSSSKYHGYPANFIGAASVETTTKKNAFHEQGYSDSEFGEFQTASASIDSGAQKLAPSQPVASANLLSFDSPPTKSIGSTQPPLLTSQSAPEANDDDWSDFASVGKALQKPAVTDLFSQTVNVQNMPLSIPPLSHAKSELPPMHAVSLSNTALQPSNTPMTADDYINANLNALEGLSAPNQNQGSTAATGPSIPVTPSVRGSIVHQTQFSQSAGFQTTMLTSPTSQNRSTPSYSM